MSNSLDFGLNSLPNIQKGTLTFCQLYDLGDEIILARVPQCITKPTARRQMSVQVRQAESIQIAQPPIQVELGERSLILANLSLNGILRANIYDLGALSLALEIFLTHPTTWTTIAQLMAIFQESPPVLRQIFSNAIEELEIVLRPSISNPRRTSLVEDYSILVVERLETETNIAALAEHPLVWAALLGEKRPLSSDATGLLSKMSYYPEDLALFGWNGALLIESDPLAAETALYLIEFANVELLLMRSYDAALDTEVIQMYRQLPKRKPRFALPLVRRYSQLQHDVQRLLAEFTEDTERVDNALKVTDDVYWNRFYSAIINVLRVDVWRSGVEHKLALLRETYSMLHDEADAERATALEWTIVFLILFEIVMALLKY